MKYKDVEFVCKLLVKLFSYKFLLCLQYGVYAIKVLQMIYRENFCLFFMIKAQCEKALKQEEKTRNIIFGYR